MAKQTAEGSNRLSIFWLKKNNFFPIGGGWRYGGIKWTYGMSGNESSISFTITTNGSEGDNIKLQYTHTNRQTDEKENMDYRVELATTPCRYGGKRYWFICPLSKNGRYCGRRVGVLFGIGKWFGCRHCGDLTYASRKVSGRLKAFGRIISAPEMDKMRDEIKRTHYRGEPTRKYRRYKEKERRFWSSLNASILLLEG